MARAPGDVAVSLTRTLRLGGCWGPEQCGVSVRRSLALNLRRETDYLYSWQSDRPKLSARLEMNLEAVLDDLIETPPSAPDWRGP